MTLRQPSPQRLQAIESELDRLRSIIGLQTSTDILPPQVRIARTKAESGSYPEDGDTFGLIFRDEEYAEIEGGPNALTGIDQSGSMMRFGRTIPSHYIAEGTYVFAVEIDDQMYIISAVGLEFLSECIDDTIEVASASGSQVRVNRRGMLRLALPEDSTEPQHPILEIEPGLNDSLLQTKLDGPQGQLQIYWSQEPQSFNYSVGGWYKLGRPGAKQHPGDPDNEFWIGYPQEGRVARYKLPPRPARSHQIMMVGAQTDECVQLDWMPVGVDCVKTTYDCEGVCWTETFKAGILVSAVPENGENCEPPEHVPDVFGCLDVTASDYNPCIGGGTREWEFYNGDGSMEQHNWQDGSLALFYNGPGDPQADWDWQDNTPAKWQDNQFAEFWDAD